MSKINNLDHQLEQASSKSTVKFIVGGSVGITILGLVILITQFPMSGSEEKSHANIGASVETPFSEEQKQSLQESLSGLKKRVEEAAVNPAKMQWDSERSSTFKPSLDAYYMSYAGGLYQSAKKGVEALNSLMDEYDAQYRAAYESEHHRAQMAFDKNNINTATIANNASLAINPDYAPAQSLKSRLDVYPTVVELLERLKQAESERNLDAQLDIIEQTLLLDPERQLIQQKHKQVTALVKDRDFSNAIRNAFAALEIPDLKRALEYAQEAKSIAPTRPELNSLYQKVDAIQKDQKHTSLKTAMNQAISNDDWNNVLALSNKGLRSFPNDPGFQAANTLAMQLKDAKSLLQIYIEKPKRMFDSNIRSVAKQDVDSLAHLTQHSASFATMIDRVMAQLKTANTPLPVMFNSDGDTVIRVLRVGTVGETDSRIVNLLPGLYEVEGRCEGYKTKIIPLEVLPNQDNSIRVVCDEKL